MEIEHPSCFKAYDIRGKVPDELNVDLAYQIGRGLADIFNLQKVVIGRDIRLSGPALQESCIQGLLHGGCNVLDIGLCGTEEIYHGAFSLENEGVDGGIMITASHNPADYNGMKIVLKGARPLSGDSGLSKLAEYTAVSKNQPASAEGGKCDSFSLRETYIDHLLSYVDVAKLKPLKIVANCGNGCAGPVLELLAGQLPFKIIMLNQEPDGTFPNGVPNPLLVENRRATAEAVKEHEADLGIAWDGDFDRCFFWDENGEFIEGYYLVGVLAREMLTQQPGSKILHDPRLIWNTIDEINRNGGTAVMTKTGHAFIKERMRVEDAVYGGEMSAHHYFRDFGYCDSGMIPWLLVASLLSKSGQAISSLVGDMMASYPVSGEINSTVADAEAVIAKIRERYGDGELDFTDGLSVAYDDFRFNVRSSNTEPVLRLNVESKGDRPLLDRKTDELLELIRG
ncbi:MAG: phosphomannomutase [Desulfocapsaceae bacterium]|nr:phosphomannomutase [Desulfocapsaceae bacterium]